MRSRVLALALAVVGLFDCFTFVYADFLFDLSIDPYETNNLLNDPSYSELKDEVLDRYANFKSIPIIADHEKDADFSVFRQAGGIVPWLNWESPPPKQGIPLENQFVPSKEEYQQPNVVLMMLDDVGWSDGSVNEPEDSWLSFTTPNMLKLIETSGIKLTHHYTGWVCGPSRAALLTGQYPYRIGYGTLPNTNMNLPLSEVTLAEKLKSVGYRTALIGKWHLGHQSWEYTPTYRGFDRFYGYYGGSVGYYSKLDNTRTFDLHDEEALVTAPEEVTGHLSQVLHNKATLVITEHADLYLSQNTPLFLYYAVPNVHLGGGEGIEAPQEYKDKCAFINPAANVDGIYDQHQAYCALLIMLDEIIGDTVCLLEEKQMMDNTLLVVLSDNGGLTNVFKGSSYPQRGGKGAYSQGGIHNLAFLYSPSEAIIPLHARNSEYGGLVHLSDWFPTLMALATNNTWLYTSSAEAMGPVDGHNVLPSIVNNQPSPRLEIFHNYDDSRGRGAMQVGYLKFIEGKAPSKQTAEVSLRLEGSFPETCLVSDVSGEAPSLSPAPTMGPATSSLSCETLGWLNSDTGSSNAVCSNSMSFTNNNRCLGVMDGTSARQLCESEGARLCSLLELEQDEARSLGCQLDANLMWSSTACDLAGGDDLISSEAFMATVGSSRDNNPPVCLSVTTSDQARGCCCADEVVVFSPTVQPVVTLDPSPQPTTPLEPVPTLSVTPPQPTASPQASPTLTNTDPSPTVSPLSVAGTHVSTVSCEEFGWQIRRGDPQVCAASQIEGSCSGDITWLSALNYCEDAGARLCTHAELLSDETRGTGCRGDGVLVWSSTACEGGYMAAYGSSLNSGSLCSSPDTAYLVRCCADDAATIAATTNTPSSRPTSTIRVIPTSQPSDVPVTLNPTVRPSTSPTSQPSDVLVTLNPTVRPSTSPTSQPSDVPVTLNPTVRPSTSPTSQPSAVPVTLNPTVRPSTSPTSQPSDVPVTLNPTVRPSTSPTSQPSDVPVTLNPTVLPSTSPTS